MTSEETTEYRRYLEELARSRGLPGAQQLAQAAASEATDPHFSVRAILEDPPGRFGRAIHAAIALSDQEKDRLARAWMHTFIRPVS
jgi:hypothetical protein